MIQTWYTTIPALSLTEQRRVYLYLPVNYAASTQRYPVLYLFDGQCVFFDADAPYGKSWRLGDFLDAHNAPLIVVAVESNPNSENARLDEYSPYNFSHKIFGEHIGKGSQTLDWYVNTLKPFVDAHYRTLPHREHTYLMGCSMGGLMAIYGLCAYNHIYHAAAAFSPSLWVSPSELHTLIRTAKFNSDTILYMDYGAVEMKQHRGMDHLFPDFAKALQTKNVQLTQRVIPNGTHEPDSWKRQLPFALFSILYNEQLF